MFTAQGVQWLVYGVCAAVGLASLVSYLRRKSQELDLRKQLAAEVRHRQQLQLELARLDDIRAAGSVPSIPVVASTEVTATRLFTESRSTTVEVPKEITIAKSRVESAGSMPLTTPAVSSMASTNVAAASIAPSIYGHGTGATTWQDRTLFAHQSPTMWRGSAAIPRLEARDTPNIGGSDYTYGAVTPVLASFCPETEERSRDLGRKLRQAGDYAPHAPENLAATRFLFMIGALLLGGVCVLLAPQAAERPLLFGTLVLTGLGWALPALFVRNKAESRKAQIERGIPDMMDMLNMCVSQGLTVPDSLARVAVDLKPVYPALSEELQIVVDQGRVGTLNEALTNFAGRVDLPQVDSFVSLLTQTERMGTSVSASLNDYSDNMRESLRQRADEKGNASAFWLLLPTVLCLMPAVFMFLMGPAVIEYAKFYNAGGLSGLNQGRQNLRALNEQEIRSGGSRIGGTQGQRNLNR